MPHLNSNWTYCFKGFEALKGELDGAGGGFGVPWADLGAAAGDRRAISLLPLTLFPPPGALQQVLSLKFALKGAYFDRIVQYGQIGLKSRTQIPELNF